MLKMVTSNILFGYIYRHIQNDVSWGSGLVAASDEKGLPSSSVFSSLSNWMPALTGTNLGKPVSLGFK